MIVGALAWMGPGKHFVYRIGQGIATQIFAIKMVPGNGPQLWRRCIDNIWRKTPALHAMIAHTQVVKV